MSGGGVIPINTRKAAYAKGKHDLIEFFYEFMWWKAMRCPNTRSKRDTSKHDPNCTLCDNGYIYIEPRLINGFITGLSRKEYYSTEGQWNIGTGSITVPPEFQLSYWDKIIVIGNRDCKDNEVTRRFSETIERGSTNVDALRYKAVKMIAANKVIGGSPDALVEYTLGVDFRVDPVTAGIQWITANKPAEGDIYSIMYTYNPVYIVQEVLHVFRDRVSGFKERGEKRGSWEKGEIQAIVKLDFLVRYE